MIFILQLRKIVQEWPTVLLPSHRSYLDFILISFIMFEHNMKLPCIAAGQGIATIVLTCMHFSLHLNKCKVYSHSHEFTPSAYSTNITKITLQYPTLPIVHYSLYDFTKINPLCRCILSYRLHEHEGSEFISPSQWSVLPPKDLWFGPALQSCLLQLRPDGALLRGFPHGVLHRGDEKQKRSNPPPKAR